MISCDLGITDFKYVVEGTAVLWETTHSRNQTSLLYVHLQKLCLDASMVFFSLVIQVALTFFHLVVAPLFSSGKPSVAG